MTTQEPRIIPNPAGGPPVVLTEEAVNAVLAQRREASRELFENLVNEARAVMAGTGEYAKGGAISQEATAAIMLEVGISQGAETVAEVLAWLVVDEAQRREAAGS